MVSYEKLYHTVHYSHIRRTVVCTVQYSSLKYRIVVIGLMIPRPVPVKDSPDRSEGRKVLIKVESGSRGGRAGGDTVPIQYYILYCTVHMNTVRNVRVRYEKVFIHFFFNSMFAKMIKKSYNLIYRMVWDGSIA